jgi:hypothetical protein
MINYKPPLPSSLLEDRTEEDFNYGKDLFSNLSLKVGIILDIIEVEDPANISKISTEYTVMTVEKFNSVTYNHCLASDGFGGISDFFNKKYRPTTNKKKTLSKTELKNQNGSVVLLLCIDGKSEQAIIIGSIAHPDRKNGKLTQDKGHHLEGEFNGVNWKIDKDGSLTVTFKSATDNDAKPQDTKAGGSTLTMEKDGSVQVSDGNKEKIRIDKTKKTIDLTAESDISITTDANANITAKSNLNTKASADILADAGGSATFKSGGAFNIQAGGAFSLQAPSVSIQSDGSTVVQGSSIQLSAPTIQVGNGGTPAVLMTTMFIGVGNLGSPVLSIACGPFSSSVYIAP